MPNTALPPLDALVHGLRQTSIVKFVESAERQFRDEHLKELTFEDVGPSREVKIGGRWLVNFGFDSFLGLDQHPRVKAALARGASVWGTQFGASRAFAKCAPEVELECKIADWMGAEAAIVFPSVTLANMGVLGGLTTCQDIIVYDQLAHNSIQEGAKIARANGARVLSFEHNDPASLESVLQQAHPYRHAIVAIDGVYSMSGAIAPMAELNQVARRNRGILFIDDAHATGVLGDEGRGTVLEALGNYDNALAVGCFSKAASVFGAFVACDARLARVLQVRSSTYIFGGPVPPPYLEAASTVIDIFRSSEYLRLRDRLDQNIRRLVDGLAELDLVVLGGRSPIISVLVGDEADCFRAGKIAFDHGYYLQSVAVPAVAYRAAVLRIQVNSNHPPEAIDGLLRAMADVKRRVDLPCASDRAQSESAGLEAPSARRSA